MLHLLVACAMLASQSALADTYPNRPITLVIPFAPGGSASTAARSVTDKMSDTLGAQIIIENRPGAGGTVATRAVAKNAPDGYTILLVTNATLAIAPSLFSNLGYNARKDFAPIGLIAATPNVIAVHPSFPARSLADLIKIGKEAATPIPYGSPGTGTLNHLTIELLAHRTGMKVSHVPYKGAGPALTDLLSGNIQLMFDTLGTALPPIKAGLLRPLGVSSAERIADLPDVPTLAESGYPDYRVSVWYGVAAPSKVPEEVAERIGDDVFRASLQTAGFPPLHSKSQAAIKEFIDADRVRWSAVIKALNISLD